MAPLPASTGECRWLDPPHHANNGSTPCLVARQRIAFISMHSSPLASQHVAAGTWCRGTPDPQSENGTMETWLATSLANALLGFLLGAARSVPRDARTALPWFDTLLLFFLGSAVCDVIALLEWGAAPGIDAYALALGFLAGAELRRRLAGAPLSPALTTPSSTRSGTASSSSAGSSRT
jgi:hypothetical protein